MNREYEDNEFRQLAHDRDFIPVIPPTHNRVAPWQYDQELYRRRNRTERPFRRLKGLHRILSRLSRFLDVVFLGFVAFELIVATLRNVDMPRPGSAHEATCA